MQVSKGVLFVLLRAGLMGYSEEASWRRGGLSGVLKGEQEFKGGGDPRCLPGPEVVPA